jgi:poly-gamma-glutamate capsule biosynthesis protein CapA/YwtB (metallophosphatase superfamily)
VHRGKLILYGCGDLINDYEGIATAHAERSDLVCLYAVTLHADGTLQDLEVMPYQLHRFRLSRLSRDEREGLRNSLNRQSEPFGTTFATADHRHWHLGWYEGA